ncbi:MAG: YtxH domain-containing protein [Balneolaceae bacterium]|nr:YtxH domain-containing protein [Balneolaceae bacterium]
MKALKIITTTLGATVIGVALGILFAPNRGSNTRHKISKKSHKYADHLSDSFDGFLDTISHSFESVENETARLAKKGKDQAKKVAADLNSSKP